MTTNNEEKISQINEGRMASITLNWLEPILNKIEKDLGASLKALFRSGQYTENVLVAHTAQLCAIDQLREKLRAIVLIGDAASDEGEEE